MCMHRLWGGGGQRVLEKETFLESFYFFWETTIFNLPNQRERFFMASFGFDQNSPFVPIECVLNYRVQDSYAIQR